VALFNLGEEARKISISVADCAAAFPEGWFSRDNTAWEEIWSGVKYETIGGEVASHGALLLHSA
jgi:hypothetical protein